MELTGTMEGLGMRGRVVLRSWERGMLGWLLGMGGDYQDTLRVASDYIVDRVETPNLIVTSGKVLVARMLMDDTGYDTGLTYCALGTDNTAPVIGDTTLTVEAVRNAITSKSRVVNVVTYSTFFVSDDCNIYVREVGLFGHSTAGAGGGSGEMFNHTLLTYDNSGASPLDLTIDVEITFG